MPRRLLILPFLMLFSLDACAWVTETSLQKITIVTPGAQKALCNVYVQGLRYKFEPPQTVGIIKSSEDMVVDCRAPGNRHKQIVVKAHATPAEIGNVATGILPGMAWDYASRAMYKYPEFIAVNFFDTPLRPEPPPGQNASDIRQPEEYDLEEFRPGTPRLNSDKGEQPPVILRREKTESAPPVDSVVIVPGDSEGSADKGNLIPPAPPAPSAPPPSTPAGPSGANAPLYPGQ